MRKVGIAAISAKFFASALASTSTFLKCILPAYYGAIPSKIGPIRLHGGHHEAVKSTIIGTPPFVAAIAASKSAIVSRYKPSGMPADELAAAAEAALLTTEP